MSIEWAGDADQTVGEIAVDAPIAFLVRVGQRGTFDWATEAGVIKLAVLGGETNFDVAQAFAISELGESHGEKLIPTRERANTLVAAIARHAAIEFVVRKKADELGKHSSTLVQGLSPSQLIAKDYAPTAKK